MKTLPHPALTAVLAALVALPFSLAASDTRLGLAIVKHLVESQVGAVGAEFPVAGGSVFWFELPAR